MTPKGENDPGSRPAASATRDAERSRKALIDATLDSIAEDGIAETTVSRIIERAGVSRGMIHLHFGGKDNLLTAAAAAFSDVYYAEMERQIATAAGDPRATILAVIRADLSEQILTTRSSAIWHALRGEARTNAAIAGYSNTRDARLRALIFNAFSALLMTGGHRSESTMVANEITLGTLALLEGMWIDYMAHPNAFSRETAVRIVCRFLAALFPDHFAA
ncbi:TetR family transcriptional regulator C-terminal domain-containing protein [Albidovulum sediminicola]|uniref:TetR family transcriptional regulator n=1 Tax=Albidovulum sediminicola TaxID=2984331 RepID=A0ABT2Z648_9RHOB|nr:TetR family transcriptional regulator [Defluviimonas sp. WL0075]MCV2866582.1 TetR family transcriptional regulator [Defluviimonas sp. WL0075]